MNKQIIFSFFIGAFVLLVPAGQALAAVWYSQTDDSGSSYTQLSASEQSHTLATFTSPITISSGTVTVLVRMGSDSNGYRYDVRAVHFFDSTNSTGVYIPTDGTGGTNLCSPAMLSNPLSAGLITCTINVGAAGLSITSGDTIVVSSYAGGMSNNWPNPIIARDGTNTNPYLEVYDGSLADSCIGGSSGTCIDTVTPADDPSILQYASSSQALATSTSFAFGSTGYIASADYATGAYVENLYQNDDYDQVAVALCSIGGCRTQIKYPISAIGKYTVASTTNIQRVGNYTMTTDIKVPVTVNAFNFFSFTVPSFLPFSEKTLVSTTTNFQVSQPSALDLVKKKLGQTYLAVGVTNGSASSTADLITGCAFTSITQIFDLTSPNNIFACTVGFVSASLIPSQNQLTAIGANFQSSITMRPPIGYITRFSAIVSGQAIGTSTLPNLTFSVPPVLGLGSESVTFDLWDNLTGSTSPFGMATSSVARGSKTFRQIVEPGWDIIVLTCLAFLVIWDALKIKH